MDDISGCDGGVGDRDPRVTFPLARRPTSAAAVNRRWNETYAHDSEPRIVPVAATILFVILLPFIFYELVLTMEEQERSALPVTPISELTPSNGATKAAGWIASADDPVIWARQEERDVECPEGGERIQPGLRSAGCTDLVWVWYATPFLIRDGNATIDVDSSLIRGAGDNTVVGSDRQHGSYHPGGFISAIGRVERGNGHPVFVIDHIAPALALFGRQRIELHVLVGMGTVAAVLGSVGWAKVAFFRWSRSRVRWTVVDSPASGDSQGVTPSDRDARREEWRRRRLRQLREEALDDAEVIPG